MKTLGLVVAMEEEVASLYSSFGNKVKTEMIGSREFQIFDSNGVRLVIVGSGIGEISAAIATTLLLSVYKCEAIINFGVVGALQSEYKCKDIVLVDEIVHYDFTLLMSDEKAWGIYPFDRSANVHSIDNETIKMAKDVLGLRTARIASGDKFINKSDFKNWLVEKFNAKICDMESMGIYLACRNCNAPLFMIKAVSDNADETAQEDFSEVIASGVTYYGKAVQKLIAALSR